MTSLPTRTRPGGRAVRRTLGVLALACGLVALVAAPASAHAELVQSDPAPGAVLDTAPTEIKLNFTEAVDAKGGAIRVFDADADGERVDEGSVEVSGSTVRKRLPGLDDGSYVVTWRVTSSDAHPISGAFTFQVGEGSGAGATSREVTGLANRLLAEQGGDQVVGAVYGVSRFVVFAGLALLIGGAFFALALWPPARHTKGARRVVRVGWLATFLGTFVGLLVYGPYAEGLGIGEVFSSSLLGDTLSVRFGQVWLARLVLLLVAVPVLVKLFARDAGDEVPSRPLSTVWLCAGAALGVALAVTPGISGHATSGDWVAAAIAADTIHVLAMSLWLGGLVCLGAVGLARNAPVNARDALEPFSRLALGCILALVATGAFQTWRQVGSLDALRTTDFGRILVVKLVLVALVVVFAAFSREVVLRLLPPRERGHDLPAVAGGSDDDAERTAAARERAAASGVSTGAASEPSERVTPAAESDAIEDEAFELQQLRRSVWAEIATAGLILIATALLVNAPPAKSANASIAEGGVAAVTLEGDAVSVDVTVTPGAAGANDVHVDVADAQRAPTDVDELTVTLALPDDGISPIDVPLRRLSPGHYYSPGFQIPLTGEWKVTAKPLLSEFEQPTLRGTIDVG
jgi:copper transport protein